MKVALFIKEDLDANEDLSTLLISKISEYDFDFDQDNPDVVVIVGGDGTLLRAIHSYVDRLDNVSFVGIHQGSLGFTCDYLIDEIDRVFSDLRDDNFSKQQIPLIEACYNNRIIYAVNEVRIENPFHTLISDIYIDDILLEKFRGNGLNICSSFGSTGYNKSLGGALIPSNLKVMQLMEIAPISSKVYQAINSPVVVAQENTIVLRGNFNECVIGYDHLTTDAINVNEICVRLSNKKVNIIYKYGYNYFEQLNKYFIK